VRITELSFGQLKKAVALKERIVNLEKEFAALIGTFASPVPTKRKDGISAKGRPLLPPRKKDIGRKLRQPRRPDFNSR